MVRLQHWGKSGENPALSRNGKAPCPEKALPKSECPLAKLAPSSLRMKGHWFVWLPLSNARDAWTDLPASDRSGQFES